MRSSLKWGVILVVWLFASYGLLGGSSIAQRKATKAPDSMGNLKWGDSTLQFRELTDPPPYKLNDEDKYGTRLGGRRISQIGDVKVGPLAYYIFFKDKFYTYGVHFKDMDSYDVLNKALALKYGHPKKLSSKMDFEWEWEVESKVSVKLTWRRKDEEGILEYVYLPILKEFKRNLEEKARDEIREKKESAEKTKDSL
jgi:hypothetical protein